MHLRKIFYGTLTFQQSSMICIGRLVGGHTLALQHGSLRVTLRCAVNVTTSSFQVIFLEVLEVQVQNLFSERGNS